MKYGVCTLGIVPLREEASDKSQLETQMLYGDLFKILEVRKKWTKIRLERDQYVAWVDNNQYKAISSEDFNYLKNLPKVLSEDVLSYVVLADNTLQLVPFGCNLAVCDYLNHRFEGRAKEINEYSGSHENIVDTALIFRNAPYLWGGKTHFGIDCSGFTQTIYAQNGINIPRNASQQALVGETLSFIEESNPGDLAFFDNEEGNIVHVGIILADNYIIHAHGKVRIDRIDQYGIFNTEKKEHTHKLRIIKSLI